MLKLLRAEFSRLRKDKTFWLVVCGSALYALFLVIFGYISVKRYGGDLNLDTLFVCAYGFGGALAVPGLLMAIFCSVFIGREFRDGAVRNKLIVGHSRTGIYFAELTVSAAVGLLVNAAYFLPVFAVGAPLIGWFESASAAPILWALLCGTLMTLAYAAAFTFVAMLSRSMTAASIISIIAVVAVMFASGLLINMINQPDTVSEWIIVDGVEVMREVPNPHKLSAAAEAFCQFLIDFLPSGQSMQITRGTDYNNWQMALYSVGLIAFSAGGGIAVFRRVDLK